MPKKQPANAFYFFMINFKEEQKKKGINYANLAEVSVAASPAWTAATPSIRAKFEAKAKQAKQANNVPEKKFTSTGECLADIQAMEKELQKKEEMERKHINNFVKLNTFSKDDIIKEVIYLIDVNSYCKTNDRYVIGEVSLLRFSIGKGIIDNFYQMLNTVPIPAGYAYDMTLGAKEFGLDMPDSSVTKTREQEKNEKIKMLSTIIDYLKQGSKDDKPLPPMYTLPDKVEQAMDFVGQLCDVAAQEYSKFRVYKLDLLLYTLVNGIRTTEREGFPQESLALKVLQTDPFQYSPALGCADHEEGDKSIECTLSRVKRWAFTVLDQCCRLLDVTPLPGKHVPSDVDLDRAMALAAQEQRESPGPSPRPSAPGTREPSECSAVSGRTEPSIRREKKRRSPVRIPEKALSRNFPPPPPSLSYDTEFPSLTISRGRGRGRKPE